MINIAIDGPSGAGKSTLSRAVAQRLGFLYVDTGAMYRAVGLAALRAGANTKNGAAVAALLPGIAVNLQYVDGAQHVFLNGEDVSGAIRTEAVGMAASDVSAHVPVRAFLLESQRRLAQQNNVLMDGRDIGTVILPNADIKIFLTATAEDRARRRWLELRGKGQNPDFETVLRDVETRDYNDTHRAASALKKAGDAIELETTGNSFEQSLALLLETITARLPAEGGPR